MPKYQSRERFQMKSKSRHKLLLSFLQLFNHLSITFATGSDSATHRHYYTAVSRLGLVRGLTWTSLNDEPAQVVAFLGLPYAAPPTGLLRFMPPGAISQNQLLQQARLEQHLLMPGAQKAQVRDHSRFGFECVHLPDWLADGAAENSSVGAGDNGRASPAKGEKDAKSLQSEDCLNLNAFVPIPIQKQHELTNGLSSSSVNSMRQQINSNYPSPLSRPPPPPTLPSSSKEHGAANHSTQQQPHSSSYPPTASSGGNSPSANQDSNSIQQQLKLWPLPLPRGQSSTSQRLPLLVVFHGQQPSAANSLNYLQVAYKTNSILVTFNCRTGLLGFLPLSDEGARRHNHAIWDQIGLLHWLKHNAAQALGADIQNVTLVAGDNQATQWVQLLAVSPHAKGLFNRVILVLDERQQISNNAQPVIDFERLKATPGDARRRLALTLTQTVASLQGSALKPSGQTDEQRALDFIQRADLTQLAQIDESLRASGQSSLLALANEPTFDDRLLFPHLAALSRSSSDSAMDRLRVKLDYCTYLRQLYSGQADPLNLIGFESSLTNTRNPAGSWHREFVNGSSAASQSLQNPTKSHRQTLAADKFYHLRRIHELAQVLTGRDSSYNEVNLGQRQKRDALALVDSHNKHLGADYELLLDLMNSYDLMIGYFRKNDYTQDNPPLKSTEFSNILSALSQVSSEGINRHLISLLRLADMHYVATLSSNHEQFCDMFTLDGKPSKTTHVFLASYAKESPSDYSSVKSWLTEIAHNQPKILEPVIKFAKSGNPNESWFNYDSLNRYIAKVDSSIVAREADNNEMLRFQDKVGIQLDLETYLSDIAQIKATKTDDDLVTCLDDIELAINKSLNGLQVDCLISVAAKYRNQLHQLAADDLDPLIRASSRQSQADSPHVASSITTRNLVTEPGQQTTFQQQGTNEKDDITSSSPSIPQSVTPKSFTDILKQMLSKPLTVIIFAGLLIFVINLIIVIAISLRSAQNRSRVRGQDQLHIGGNQLDAISTINTNGVFGKKPTLKQPTDLHSAIKSSNTTNLQSKANKQLTFSLPGSALSKDTLEHQEVKNLSFGCPLHDGHNSNRSEIELSSGLDERQKCSHHHHHHLEHTFVENAAGDLIASDQSSELVLSATSIQNSHQGATRKHAQIVFQGEWPQTNTCQLASSESANQSNSSPLGYLSHSTATTSGTFRRASGSLESPLCNNQLQLGVNFGSQLSPESSTTLSVTPLQLETFVPYNYQLELEPVEVIYHGQSHPAAANQQQQQQVISDKTISQQQQQCQFHQQHHYNATVDQLEQDNNIFIMSDMQQ